MNAAAISSIEARLKEYKQLSEQRLQLVIEELLQRHPDFYSISGEPPTTSQDVGLGATDSDCPDLLSITSTHSGAIPRHRRLMSCDHVYSRPMMVPRGPKLAYSEEDGQWHWNVPLTRVLLMGKPQDAEVDKYVHHALVWFSRYSIKVLVDSRIAQRYPNTTLYDKQKDQADDQEIDLIVAIGGDGTLLYVNNLFQGECPPILAFNCGSLGFLTPFSPHEMDDVLERAVRRPLTLTKRSRLQAWVETSSRAGAESGEPRGIRRLHPQMFTVLNEISIQRELDAHICTLDTYLDGRFMTVIQADGLLISTSTGSTAYAMSAGGIPVHPEVDCILLTPTCPHVLSGRQVAFPLNHTLKVKLPRDARSTCWASFDGLTRIELRRGQSVCIRAGKPLQTITFATSSVDWVKSLVHCLNWNVRVRQKAFSNSDTHAQPIKEVGDLDSDET
ncbi:putative Inorganic polyphosphate/ATP-NAD kinase [Giardia muris]|uniref:Putative Inorganic polyphosphate/ATP-NAD kinase n=1 Tax=Giardia muris TaxID=5742 RepID=A0A4Z1SRT0_GIAMU|nr:putative Inorganic polyphosphate/ATP-NAD kinase [Giardia muris]|eukprot:TNJ28634.1 putative Inorganic polyphosphate/ATP-NAD kinase [Giardia muris]